ncbi:MAG: DUF3267 domain-containing protein [Eubacteriales bacterium]|nr:DUF3267 domain-containing protein [Eubacteriales bacterium]
MSKKERQLTPDEKRRKADFEIICEEMEKKGYFKKDLTVSVLKANIMAFIIMLPFMAVVALLYYTVNSTSEMVISLKYSMLLFLILLCLVVLHKLIHGITWGIFAKKHFHSIDFGIILSALTPYCTCSEPMKKWQYILGGAMPTLVLGGGLGVAAIATGQLILFLLSELMILSGGGDFLIILKILLYRSGKKETVYYDHPYECGVVVFEK